MIYAAALPGPSFLSTLSLRRATSTISATFKRDFISIHALLAESDFSGDHGHINGDISIHALLAESDSQCRTFANGMYGFLSTLSLRRATIVMVGLLMCNLYFYPRSPCGERHLHFDCWKAKQGFLSTLSLRRATRFRSWPIPRDRNFYPRSPCGERRKVPLLGIK